MLKGWIDPDAADKLRALKTAISQEYGSDSEKNS